MSEITDGILKLEVITRELEEFLIARCKEALREIPSIDSVVGGRSRIRRYGWDYNDPSKWVGDFPLWLGREAADYWLRGYGLEDSVTINEYSPGCGILPHIDSLAFGDPICILSLGSAATMIFHSTRSTKITRKLFIPPRSLITLTGSIRSRWKHSIPSQRSDTDGLGVKHMRTRRWSIVFRRKVV